MAYGRAIQPELYSILCQANVIQWEEVRVALDELGVELLQDQPVGGKGGTGDQKGLHSPLVSQGGVPAVRESTQATSVPGNPVTRECLHPVPPRQEPRLCGHLLNLPWGGPTGPALGQAKEPGFEVEEGVSLGSELVQPALQDSRLSPGLNLHFSWL